MNTEAHLAASTPESQPLADTAPTDPLQPPALADDLDLDSEPLGERQPEALQLITCAGGCE